MSRSEKLRTCGGREHPRHQSADFTFQVLGSFTRTKSDSPNIASTWVVQVSEPCSRSCALSSTLSTFCFWFYGETLLSRSHVKDTPYSTFHSIGQKSSSSLGNLPASRTYRSNEDHPSTSWSYSSRFTQMSCFRADKSIANACCRPVWHSGISFEKRGYSQSVEPSLRKLFPPIDEY